MEHEFFAGAYGAENGAGHRLSRAIARAFPGKAIVEGLKSPFDVEEAARAGLCAIEPRPTSEIHVQWSRAHGLTPSAVNAVFDVAWKGRAVVVVHASWREMFDTVHRNFVIADDPRVAEELAAAVSAYCNDPHDAILVFNGGCWSKKHDLWKAIQKATFDDLVLAGNMKEEIREDFTAFLGAREEYARYGVPWKRGVLFVGPPGNGKTHCVRAALRLVGLPVLYVQSLKHRYETDDANIARVFERAREVTPCCLVFEDLDAMITPENRSVFLNQLDGFADASGMLTLATTNHPEKLDPSILERPSRFDRKYNFALPAPAERARYSAGWRERLDPAMRIGDEELDRLVVETDGFSFAYLKELFLSAMIRWMRAKEPGTMFGILEAQLKTLREHMKASGT
jgi:hypothetical protein